MNAAAASRGVEDVLNLGRSAYIDSYLVRTLLSVQLPLYPSLRIKQTSNFSHELAHQVALGKLDMALVNAVPDTPKLDLLVVAETPLFIALLRNSELCAKRELRLEDLDGVDWILPAPHVNPHLHERIQSAKSKSGIGVPEVHHITMQEEAFELILAHKGVAFMTRSCAWRIARDGVAMRPLAEDRLMLQTKLATNAENKSRLVSEFVRAAGRKLATVRPPQQPRLPMAC